MKYFPLLLFACGSAASAIADERPESAQAAKPFVHPGLLHSRAELKFIQKKLTTGEQPWKSAWEKLQSAEGASLSYRPKPFSDVVRGVRNNPNIGSSEMSSDAAAYSRKVADKERPEGSHRQPMSWGTLMSYGLPRELNPIEVHRTGFGGETRSAPPIKITDGQ